MSEMNSVLWPSGVRDRAAKPLAPRLDTLDGKTVAFLWDYLFRGDEIFDTIRSELTKRYRDVSFVDHETFGSTHGGDEHAVLERLASRLREHRVDGVISGMAC
ncbi:MAG: hypothetical protein AAF493_14300 [Pseudomonadota bacterium]